MPSLTTSSLERTTSSRRITMFSASLGWVLASLNTCLAGVSDITVPSYTLPSLVYIRQYSPSRLGVTGEPTTVKARSPLALMERTIRPKVSRWADIPSGSLSSSPSTSTTTLPRLFCVHLYPRSVTIFFTSSVALWVNPEGLSTLISALILLIRSSSYFFSSIA